MGVGGVVQVGVIKITIIIKDTIIIIIDIIITIAILNLFIMFFALLLQTYEIVYLFILSVTPYFHIVE